MIRPGFLRIAEATLKAAIILVNPSMRDRFDAVQEWASQILPPDPENDVAIRDLQRQIDSTIDKVAEYLENIRDVEYRDVQEGDVAAGLLEVSEVLNTSLTLFQADEIVAKAATPSSVAVILRGRLEAHWASQPISEGAKNFSRTVLDATCYQLVNWVREIPSIQNKLAWQTLINTWNLSTSTAEILRELRQTGVVGARDADRIANSQRRDIATVLGKMDLIGMPVESRFRRIPFSTSYVTAHATSRGMGERVVPFDELLSILLQNESKGHSQHGIRLLVNGRAGSGKTTVAQWLAYQSATGQLDDRHPKLANTIPFFVRLRAALEQESAIPADTSLLMSGQLREGLGADWLEILTAYRPVIVLDGWDEVGTARRSLAAAWLVSLCERFPMAHIVVTTRPESSSDPTFSAQHFATANMTLLGEEDKSEVIKRWFLGLRANLTHSPDLDEIYLSTAQAQLLRDIRTPSLSKLAETPLLVAMLCCLYATSSRRNPISRNALYETVISVLIHHRDRDRGVKSDAWDELQPGQKEDFLGAVALVMSKAGVLSLPLSTRVSPISIESIARDILPSFGIPKSAAGPLSSDCLKRSMVLQGVGNEEAEFVHRTFQDYFTGGLLARQRNTQALFELANKEISLGILPFAARAADQTTTRDIIEWLVFQIDNCTNDRYEGLAYTAVECLNAAMSIDPLMRSEAVRAVGPLFPPENSDQAAALASVGDAAVEFLEVGTASHLERYCIEALSRIGTPRAIDALTEYARVRGHEVAADLIAAWDWLPDEDYAEAVLSKVTGGSLKVRSPAQLRSAPKIRFASSITIDGLELSQDAIVELASLVKLRDLTITGCRGLEDCRAIERLASLHTLQLANMSDLAVMRKISASRLRHLSLLDLRVRGVEWEEAIGQLTQLRVLWIEGVKSRSGSTYRTVNPPAAVLRRLPMLRTLVLDVGNDKADLSFLDELSYLSVFRHTGWIDRDGLRRIGRLPGIRSASLTFSPEGSVRKIALTPLRSLARLQDLSLSNVVLGDGCRLGDLHGLKELRCRRSEVLAIDAAFFPGSLQHLEFRHCFGLRPQSTRRVLENVKSLVWQGPGLSNLDFLQNFPSLEHLEIIDAEDLGDVAGVSYLPDGCRGRITGGKGSANQRIIQNIQYRCAILYEPRESWETVRGDYVEYEPGYDDS